MAENLEVSWSKIRTWRRCHNQYRYKYIERLAPKRPAVPLLRGRIIGECLDAITLRRVKTQGAPHWNEVLAKYMDEYRTLFREEQEMYGSLIDDIGNLIKKYERIYENDGLTYFRGSDGNPYEIRVELELMPGVTFIGYIDKIAIDKHKRVFVLDHKSHKVIPDEDTRFSDLQLVFYIWACQQMPSLPKPDGVIWDYLRTKPPTIPELLVKGGLSQRKNMDTDYATYHQAITDNKLDPKDYQDTLNRLKAEGHNSFYKRVTLPSPPRAMVNAVVNDARITAQEIIHLGGKSNTRTMDRTCKTCSYYSLCQTELRGLDADFIRKTEYITREVRYHDKEKISAEE